MDLLCARTRAGLVDTPFVVPACRPEPRLPPTRSQDRPSMETPSKLACNTAPATLLSPVRLASCCGTRPPEQHMLPVASTSLPPLIPALNAYVCHAEVVLSSPGTYQLVNAQCCGRGLPSSLCYAPTPGLRPSP